MSWKPVRQQANRRALALALSFVLRLPLSGRGRGRGDGGRGRPRGSDLGCCLGRGSLFSRCFVGCRLVSRRLISRCFVSSCFFRRLSCRLGSLLRGKVRTDGVNRCLDALVASEGHLAARGGGVQTGQQLAKVLQGTGGVVGGRSLADSQDLGLQLPGRTGAQFGGRGAAAGLILR